MRGGELIVLYKSPAQLAEDQAALHAELRAELARLNREDELVRAAFEGTDALAKASPSEISFAKSEASRIETEFLGDCSLYGLRRLAECLKRDREKWAEHDRLAARSAQFCKRLGLV
jgi:hypothetical protein